MTEKLPAMISKAAQALAKATSAAEVLEAKKYATVAYDAAKLNARLSEASEAYDEIRVICRQTMADALLIETRAQCRLADEYDAAQERGEVKAKPGGDYTSIVPKKNEAPSASDIGLTRKLIHEARKIRDAEKKKPGAIQKMLDENLIDGKDPSRAEVRRAVNEVIKPKEPKPKTRSPKQSELDDRNAKIIKLADNGWTVKEIAKEFDLVDRLISRILEVEKAKRSGPTISPASLSMTAQEKLEAALRQGKRKLEAEFDLRLRNEVRKRLEDTILPSYNKSYEEYRDVIKSRKGIMAKADYRKIVFCVHPDRIASMKDETLSRRFRDAYDLLVKIEKRLLDEKESPTELPPIPRTYEEMMKARAAVMAKRRAQREASRSALVRR